MKKFSFLALAAVGLLFGACSDKDAEVAEETFNQYDLIEGQSAWISLGIALPGDGAVTRSNEDLHDGDEAEYAVYSAKLVLFKGADEENATLIKDYSIASTDWSWDNEDEDNAPAANTYSSTGDDNVSTSGKKYGEVTSTSTKVVKEIDSPSLGGQDNLYGYVILNCDNNLTNISYTPGTKFSVFKQQVLKAIGIADETNGYGSIKPTAGLVMTNVPISGKIGGTTDPTGATITTLADIDKNAVYKTRAAAEAGTTSACIYVERAAVKVEVGVASGLTQVELPYGTTDVYTAVTPTGSENPQTEGWFEKDGTIYTASTDGTVDGSKTYYKKETKDVTYLNFTFAGWALGNVNYGGDSGTGYYNTRQFDTEWLPYNNLFAESYLRYRMVGRTPFFDEGHHNPIYRTYFGRDVNYTNAPLDPTKLTYTSGSEEVVNFATTNLKHKQIGTDKYTLGNGGVTYTYENTFDENSQIWANTTYVGVKINIGSEDFYTIEGQPNTKLNLSDLPSEVAKNHSVDISTANTAIQTAIHNNLTKADGDLVSGDLNHGKTAATKIKEISFSLVPEVSWGDRAADGSVPYTFTLKLDNVQNKIGDATSFTPMNSTDVTTLNALVASTLDAEVSGTTKIYKYVGGAVYYSMRISHFGDVETPWSAPESAYNNYNAIYPTNGKSSHTGAAQQTYSDSRASAWLGRWGIVRNNWYKLTIDEIKGLGSPVPEDYSGIIGGTPDDNPETKYYIAAHVHILPWAVRTQSVKF